MNNTVVFESDTYRQYGDGREEVFFTAEEWEVMVKDPAFGYVRRCGHRTTFQERQRGIFGDCLECEFAGDIAEQAEYYRTHVVEDAAQRDWDDEGMAGASELNDDCPF